LVGQWPTPLIRVECCVATEAKRQLLAKAANFGEEGVVFKLTSAPYTPDRPASGGPQFKFKLVETATVRVRAIWNGKRSVEMKAIDASGAWVSDGFVTILPNLAIRAVGARRSGNLLKFSSDDPKAQLGLGFSLSGWGISSGRPARRGCAHHRRIIPAEQRSGFNR
jgi:hypothetical protein